MDATAMMIRLGEVIDAHAWDSLTGLLHDDFSCRYAHTGEVFGRDSWVRLNAEYPGFDRFTLSDCVGSPLRAAGRSHVTAYAGAELRRFEVATFISLRDDLIAQMTEVWAEVDVQAAEGTRPA